MSALSQLKDWAANLKRDIFALYLATKDERVPWTVKVLAIAITAYAFSPIDLIPDFIPVLGYLDDLLILPLGVALVLLLIPKDVMEDLREKSAAQLKQKPVSRFAAAIIVVIWIFIAVVLGLAVLRWAEI